MVSSVLQAVVSVLAHLVAFVERFGAFCSV